MEHLPSTTRPLRGPRKPRKARTSLARQCNICLHPKVVLPIQLPWERAPWVLSGPASFSHPQRGVLHSCGTAAHHCQPPGRGPQPKNTRKSSARPCENCFHRSADLPVLSALRKFSFASERPCQPHPSPEKATLPQKRPINNASPRETFQSSAKSNTARHREYNSTKKKKTTSK